MTEPESLIIIAFNSSSLPTSVGKMGLEFLNSSKGQFQPPLILPLTDEMIDEEGSGSGQNQSLPRKFPSLEREGFSEVRLLLRNFTSSSKQHTRLIKVDRHYISLSLARRKALSFTSGCSNEDCKRIRNCTVSQSLNYPIFKFLVFFSKAWIIFFLKKIRYAICGDEVIRRITKKRPSTRARLANIEGVNQVTF